MKQEFQSTTGVTMRAADEPSVANPVLGSADDVYVMPATQGQIRFWSLDQMHPGNPALNMPLMWQCRGELDVDLLAMAFTYAVRRHEMLRTTFAMVDGSLAQIIGKSYSVAPAGQGLAARSKRGHIAGSRVPHSRTCGLSHGLT